MTWTSAKLLLERDNESVQVQVNDDIINEVKATVAAMLAERTVSLKALRTLAGQATCIASLLHAWRPFVGMLWAPMYDPKARCRWDQHSIWIKSC